MEITVINVGYGDALLIETAGKRILVDGGSAMAEEYEAMPHRIRAADYLAMRGIDSVDTLVITHIHEDHVCGLEEVLGQIRVGEIWCPFDPEEFSAAGELFIGDDAPGSAKLFTQALNAFVRICGTAKRDGIPMRRLQCGEVIRLGEDAICKVLAPTSHSIELFMQLIRSAYSKGGEQTASCLIELDRRSNASSLVLLLETREGSVLLTGDSISDNWGHMAQNMLQNVNVLKLPHHGQADSISQEMVRLLSPGAVITTTSSDRRYGSACPVIYDRFRQDRSRPLLLFSDEREYPPYCSQPEGFCAIRLQVNPGVCTPEFIDKSNYVFLEEKP